MLFFFLNMLLCLVLAFLLLLILRKCLYINWQRRNRRPIGYLTPVILTLVFTWFSATQVIPRLLDLPILITRRLVTEDMMFTEDGTGWITLESNEQIFIYNRWQQSPLPDVLYRVSYTPHSLQIISIQEINETASRVP